MRVLYASRGNNESGRRGKAGKNDTVHCGGLGTSDVELTFKCHLLGRKDLLAAHDLGVIVRG